MAGMKAAAYKAYRDRFDREHANMVQPVLCKPDAEMSEALGDINLMVSGVCKYWDSFGRVAKLADGRVVEWSDKVWTGNVAVFPNHESWVFYTKAMPSVAFFEEW